MKKYKIQWQEEDRYCSRYKWLRPMHELLPNSTELGSGEACMVGSWLDWKAEVAVATGFRKPQKANYTHEPIRLPYRALPLITLTQAMG